MDIAHSVPSVVKSISFHVLSSEDIRRISVQQITNLILLDDLNRPTPKGLYDPGLGPASKRDVCTTCRLDYFRCPGHFGHIELPVPVYHPLFITTLYSLLNSACLFCHKFRLGPCKRARFIGMLRLLDHGLLAGAQTLEDFHPDFGSKDNNDQDDINPDDPAVQVYLDKIEAHVSLSLQGASGCSRDDYKQELVYQYRKQMIKRLLQESRMQKCLNCKAFAFTYRKQDHTKIIRYDLSPSQKQVHQAMNVARPDVLSSEATQNHVTMDEEILDPSEEDERAPQAKFTDDEASDDQRRKSSAKIQLPRTTDGREKTARGRQEFVLLAEECRAHIRRLFANDAVLCSLIFGRHGPYASLYEVPSGPSWAPMLSPTSADMFFLEVIPVTPTRFRPPRQILDALFEHPQNDLLSKILNISYRIKGLAAELRVHPAKDSSITASLSQAQWTTTFESMIEMVLLLQTSVNSFLDSTKNPTLSRGGKPPPDGVRQVLEKKEGLFRKNMMGKRVNHAARSVISPDVNIETNEIGVPPVFATKLTIPVPVTNANVHELRKAVINGPTWPGANMIQLENGEFITLGNSIEKRTAIANQLLTPQRHAAPKRWDPLDLTHSMETRTTTINKKVHRHLRDGDFLILNRQPTLHKPSMMVHKAKILKGEKTIRMHYANCNSYNADFDGDEMNIHVPQNEIPRAEAMMIANTDNQYLVPTSGAPLRGLIQDHVVAGVWMTNKQTFFTREEYHQIIYGALRPENEYTGGGTVLTVPPAIWKPQALWTGKQIISTVMKNITPSNSKGLNLESKAKVLSKYWGTQSTEQDVIFADGELVCGILDKSQFGATPYGMVHAVYELYGADIAGKLLGILSRLFTKFLQHRAFTCRMDDLALTPGGEAGRRKILEESADFGTEAAVENFPSLSDPSLSDNQKATSLKALLEDVLRDDHKMASLDVTVKNKMRPLKSKLDEKCVPGGLLRKFPDNHMQAMVSSGAKGSGVNANQISSALGQQELEGRRVPVMISGKTLPSFKAFETAAVAGGFIASRFLTGLKPQEFYFHCMAGREGLIDTAVKTSRSGYLQRCLVKHLEGIRVHYDHTVRGSDSSVYQFLYGGDGLDVTRQKYLLDSEKQKNLMFFASQNQQALADKVNYTALMDSPAINKKDAVAHAKKFISKPNKYPPTLSKYSPWLYLGATSEKFSRALNEYIDGNPHGIMQDKETEAERRKRKRLVNPKIFRRLMYARYLRSLVDPGEAVGALAAQGVGEPSTQMTLNTFHFAGHGAANVTLGIPRLREIIMTASRYPKTPTMTLPVAKHASLEQIEAFCKRASRLTLSQVVDFVQVKETIVMLKGVRQREYTVTLELFPCDQYEEEYHVKSSEVLKTIGSSFGVTFTKEIRAELKKRRSNLKSMVSEIGTGVVTREQVASRTGAAEGSDERTGDGEEAEQEENHSEVSSDDSNGRKGSKRQNDEMEYESDDDELDYVKERDVNEPTEEEEEEEGEDEKDEKDDAQHESLVLADPSGKARSSKVSLVDETLDKVCPWYVPGSLTFSHKRSSRCTFNLQFSVDTPKLLLVGIIEKCCNKAVVRELKNVTRCLHVKNTKSDSKDQSEIMMTEGSNFRDLWGFAGDTIDLDGITSNDIYAILQVYGVEAARRGIISEIQGIFASYGIGVDGRHIELIADYMTFDGGYKPFNRAGIATLPSPLLRVTYETSATFISDATLHGDFDTLTTPSGAIVMGRPIPCGTGVFDVLADLSAAVPA